MTLCNVGLFHQYVEVSQCREYQCTDDNYDSEAVKNGRGNFHSEPLFVWFNYDTIERTKRKIKHK
jgi:hypothetical protein